MKIFRGFGFSNMFYDKKRKLGNDRNRQKAFSIKKQPVLTVYRNSQIAKK